MGSGAGVAEEGKEEVEGEKEGRGRGCVVSRERVKM